MTSVDTAPDVVCLRGVGVRAGGRIVLDVPHLRVRRGERIGIVGPNGAGKSTLLRMLAGFAPIDQGEVAVLGRTFGPQRTTALDRRQWRALRTEVGQVMQGLNLVPRLTARENVLIGASGRLQQVSWWRTCMRLYPEALVAEADAAMEALGVRSLAEIRADRLSGGERQRVALARLLLQKPRLVLADEPTAALDPSATSLACEVLRNAPSDGTLITVVHQPDLLGALSERVIGMAHGRIVWDLALRSVDEHALRALYGTTHPRPFDRAHPPTATLRDPLSAH